MRRRIGLAVVLLLALSLGARQVFSRTFARTVELGGNPLAVAIDAPLGRAFVLNGAGGTVSMLDARTGRLLGTAQAGLGAQALAIDETTDRVFVANNAAGSVSVIDARTAMLLRTITVGGSPERLAVDPGVHRIFVVTAAPDAVVVLDGRTGAVEGRLQLGEQPSALAVDTRRHRLFVASARVLRTLDTRSGALVRLTAAGTYPLSIAVDSISGRAFLVNGGDGTVSVVQSRTGRLLRTVRIRGYPIGSAVDERRGRVLVASTAGLPGMSDSGWISVLNAADGAPITSFPLPESVLAIQVDARDGRILADCGANVLVLDEETGAVLQRIATGGIRIAGADALAVDARSGRAFAVNTYDAVAGDANPLRRLAQRWLPFLWHPAPSRAGSVTLWDASR